LVEGSENAVLSAAHDLSDGGLGQSLVEMALRTNTGADLRLPADADPFVALFSESASRAVVVVDPSQQEAFTNLCGDFPVSLIGVVGDEPELRFDGLFSINLDELREAHTATLPALFG